MHTLHIAILLIAVTLESFSQGHALYSKFPEAELFTIENGMSQTRVNTCFSDSYGYLWVGTSDGLNRYDGYGFLNFKHIPYDSTSLSHNFIRCITEDENHNLWIGTNYGLNLYDRQLGSFRQFIYYPDDSSTVSDYQVLSVFADKKGFVWIKTEKTLDRMDISDNSVTHFHHFVNSVNHNPITQYCPVIEDKHGLLWFGNNDGLFSFDRASQTFSRYVSEPGKNSSLSDNEVLSLYIDSKGDFWIGTRNGLNLYNRKNRNFKRYLHVPEERINSAYDAVNSIVEDPQGNLWLGGNRGLVIFRRNTLAVERISTLSVNKSQFILGPVAGLIMDNSRIIWMSGFQGLFKLDTKPKKFRLYNSSSNSYPELSGDLVSCIFKEDNNLIWVGIWQNGLNILDRSTGAVTRYFPSNPDRSKRIKSDRLRCVFRDRNGMIWLGSADGIQIFNPGNRTFSDFEDKFPDVSSSELHNRRVYCILEDLQGDIWIGTDEGVLRFQRNLNLVTRYNKIFRNNITTEIGIVYSLATLNDNRIWIGTENGLNCYDQQKDLFYRYEETGMRNDLSSRLVYSLFVDSQNTLWVGTASGLNRYNPAKDNFDVFTEKSGLSNDLVNAILEDGNHCLWISTNKGISRYDVSMDEFDNFDVTQGLQSYEFNYSVAFKAEDGEMFFGGISGFNSFYPEKLPLNPNRPETVITSFEILDNYGSVDVYPGGGNRVINLKYKKSFRVKFAALDFTLPASNLYEYSMQFKGKDEHWVPLGSQNSVTFSNIHPGNYILKVRGSNNDHLWNDKGTSITIVCEAPIWGTRFAYVVYLLLSVLVIYSIIHLRTKSLRKSNRVLRDREITAREISRQKDLLSLRNKNIEDSLNYAQRIQKAMLTTPKQFRTIIPESFILHKPKDIVSGDFYWISEQDNKIFVAAADCTGHGVPGAFMSLISLELFRKIIKTENVFSPAGILNSMNKNFEEIFGNKEDIAIKDGMDLTLCVFDKSMKKLEFSGAFNPIYIVRDNNLIELKGDRFSIGAEIGAGFPEKNFTNHDFLLKPNDMIYMFSDGYADQFGGVEGKKYKYRRFRHLLLIIHQLPLEKQKSVLDDNIEKWKGETEQIDDILVIGIRVV